MKYGKLLECFTLSSKAGNPCTSVIIQISINFLTQNFCCILYVYIYIYIYIYIHVCVYNLCMHVLCVYVMYVCM